MLGNIKKQGEKKSQLIAERRDRDINAIMNTEEGRRFIRMLLGPDITRYYLKTHGKDSHNSDYLAGKRSAGVDIVALLNTANKNNFAKLIGKEQEDTIHGD